MSEAGARNRVAHDAPPTVWAPYMRWAKHHPAARYDLCNSNLLPCTLDDLPGGREALELAGPNDEGYAPLVEAIAARYGVDTSRVCTAAGTSGANFLVMASLVRPGDHVLLEHPVYDPLVGAARLLGAEVRHFERRFEDGFALDPERVAAALTDRTRLVVVTNLHNPSGVLAAQDRLDAVADAAERTGARVLVDEVYLETLTRDRPRPAATHGDVFVSTNSLTKSYGLSGLRLGWVLGSPDVVEAVRRVRDVVDAVGSFPSDRLGLVAFQQIERLAERARRILEPHMDRLQTFVAGRTELEWVAPVGGSVAFPRLRGVGDAAPFVHRLLTDYETGVVPGSFFGAPAHFRIAVGGETDALQGGLAAIGRALDAPGA